MRYRVLGPIEVWRDECQVMVGGPQQKALLAVLLMNANRVVSTDRLVEHLWGERPPVTARGLLQGCVAQLRRVLSVDDGTPDAQPLLTRPPGYLLRVAPGELDLHRFEELAGVARATPEPRRRSGILAEALALWHGPALDGIGVDACQAEAARLEERRLAVLEERIEVDLLRDAHAAQVSELQALVRRHPLRERLWALLMAALYATDRQVDALASFMELREILVDQLGVEPSPVVQELHRQILTGTDPAELVIPIRRDVPGSRPATALSVPAQLPAAPAAFVGRGRHIARLDELLADAADVVKIGVISGTAGVGKTALAVHWAHQVRDHFEDGQLYVNLRGYAPAPPMRPLEAVAGFLRALGVTSDQVPVDPEEAAALYRSLLAGKRVLIVLDNAQSVEQVRPLLPGSPGCLVLVTTRERLTGLIALDGGRPLTLDVLEPAEALALLTRQLGPERVEAEPAAAVELARLCARLPLALRIAAAILIGHPRRSIAEQVTDLGTGDRLDALTIGGDEQCAMRAALDQSHAALEPESGRMFRLLGLVPGPDFTAEAAAALADIPVAAAWTLLDRLAAAHLVDQPEPGRFALHDLLRLYARERVADEADHPAATERLRSWYLEMADAAVGLLCPQVLRLPRLSRPRRHAGPAAALAWLDAERPNLVAATIDAAAHEQPVAWFLADALRGYCWLRRHSVDWFAVAEAGLAAARAAGEPRAQAAAEFSLGLANLCANRYQQAIDHQARALALCEESGWDEGAANALGNLGVVHFELGELDLAAGQHRRALEVNRRLGSARGEAVNLDNLGHVHLTAGRLAEAGEHLRGALDVHRRLGDQHSQAFSCNQLGVMYGRLGRTGDAIDALTEALALYQTMGNLNGQAMTLGAIAAVHNDAGAPDDGLELAESALELVQQTGDRYTEAFVRNRLGTIHQRLGEHSRAISHHGRALFLARETGARYPEVEALTGVAAGHLARGATFRALALAGQALGLADDIGYQILGGQALVLLAGVHLALGEPDRAADHAHRAQLVADKTGDQLVGDQAELLARRSRFSSSDRLEVGM